MIILDIDQDYFLPVLSRILLKDPYERNQFYHEAPVKYRDIFNFFNLSSFNGIYKVLDDHNEAYDEISKINGIHKIIHLDAHDDVCHDTNLNKLDLGNWLTYLIMDKKIDPNIIWINQETIKPCVSEYNVMDSKYRLHTSQIKDFNFSNKIDCIFFTRSKEFCPDNSIEQNFISLLKNRGF